jgi:hypothetical protein
VLPFLEPPPFVNLTLDSLEFNGNLIEADIGLRHPFLGLTEFTGFDVCGVFISNGSSTGFTDPDLVMAGSGDTRLLNPDGVTRWWNPAEFPANGTMFGYVDGLLGAPDSFADFNSTINPYKYYCDDIINPDDPLSTVDITNRGMFSPGQKNSRHFTIELGSAGLAFNYAIDASWQFPQGDPPFTAPDDFSEGANKVEAWRADVTEVSNSLWNDGSENGGSLAFTIDLYDWFNSDLNTVTVESPGNFDPIGPLSATGGGTGYSTYEVDIASVTPQTQGSIDVLIIAECESEGFGGLLPGKIEAAYFLYRPAVSSEPGMEPVCEVEVVTPMPYEGWATAIEFDASASYDPGGGELTCEWDFNDDGIFGDTFEYGTDENPRKYFGDDFVGDVCVRVSNGSAQAECCVAVDITAYQSKNINLRSNADAMDIAINSTTGDLYVFYDELTNAGQVWKYTYDNYYLDGTKQFDTLWNQWLWDPTHRQYLEINPDGYYQTGGSIYIASHGYVPQTFYYQPGATGPFDYEHLWSCQFVEPMPLNIYHDIYAMGLSGSRAKDMGVIYGYDSGSSHWMRIMKHHDTHFDFSGWSTYSFTGTDYTGQEKLYWQYVVAAEGDRDGDYLWFVENTDCYGSKWQLNASNIAYDSAYFGTGTAGDPDTTWNDARDLTRDDQNRYFVLDELSTGQPRVKAFDVSSSPGESLEGFGNSTFIAGEPQRIEGTDFDTFVVVLHGDTAPMMISIFSGG